MHTGFDVCAAKLEDGYMIDTSSDAIIDNAVTVIDAYNNDVPMCERCAWIIAEMCDDDDMYHTDYVYTEDTCRYYSRDYAESELYMCADCGTCYEYSDSLRYINGAYYCDSCAGEHSVIGYYHDNKYSYNPIGGTWSDNLIGCEIESDGYDYDVRGDAEECAMILHNVFGDAVVFEEDCSLRNGGFETITQPHTLDALMNFDFESMADIMMRNGADENPSTAGLHLHFSRSWLGDTEEEQHETAARIVISYHRNFDTLLELSNRVNPHSVYEYAADTAPRGETLEDIYNDATWSRYRAVNLTNRRTIEFRLGAGYLDADYIRAWIRLHVAMIEACRDGYIVDVNHDYTISLRDTRVAA